MAKINKTAIFIVIFIAISALASVILLKAYLTKSRSFTTKSNHAEAIVDGYPNIRYWGDDPPPYLSEIIDHLKQSLKVNPSLLDRFDLLALSGGGGDGAYGAGFLKGWSDRDKGQRPEFNVVTGVSTGALIAPFAFLGRDYDDNIKKFYTEVTADDIYVLQIFTAILGGSSLGDTTPLRNIIREEINDDFVAKIAQEYYKGRALLIGTTNLDAQKQMIWDLTRIAASGNPNATELIGDILLASASLPGLFPPVMIDVNINGEQHQELHVDGGVTHEIFAYPPSLDFNNFQKNTGGLSSKRNFWLIRNTKIDPEYKLTGTSLIDIATRSIDTLTKYQGRGDLVTLERLAERDGHEFNLTYVPQNFNQKPDNRFDPKYMKSLYNLGYKSGLSQNSWEHDLTEIFKIDQYSEQYFGPHNSLKEK